MNLPNGLEAVLWNGSQLEEVPNWVVVALNNFNYNEPGWIMRENRATESVILVGTANGEKIAHPGDYITYEDGILDVWTNEDIANEQALNTLENNE